MTLITKNNYYILKISNIIVIYFQTTLLFVTFCLIASMIYCYAFTQGLKKIIHLYFLYLFHKFFCTYLWFVIK
ncbi:hypothetical protein D5V02_08860 [Campylobacter jejuni]|nr:hypothetical protein [Campylobacter jejuni]